MANIKYADPTYTDIPPTDDDKVMFRTGAGGDARGSIVQPKGYIDGLRMEWVSGTQVRVTPGAAYVPGPKRIAELASAVVLTPSLAASTWYHVYLTVVGTTVSVEASTTAPAAPYTGTARAKTGDTLRRYLGSFKTNAASQVLSFLHDGLNHVRYMEDATGAPFRVLLNGVASSSTTVSASGAVPITGLIAEILSLSTASTDTLYIGVSTGSPFIINLPPGQRFYSSHPLNANQELIYRYAPSAPASGAYIDVHGYFFGR